MERVYIPQHLGSNLSEYDKKAIHNLTTLCLILETILPEDLDLDEVTIGDTEFIGFVVYDTDGFYTEGELLDSFYSFSMLVQPLLGEHLRFFTFPGLNELMGVEGHAFIMLKAMTVRLIEMTGCFGFDSRVKRIVSAR